MRQVQWLLLAVGWFTFGTVARADEPPSFDLAIRLEIDRSIAARLTVHRIQSEAAAIWEPYRVHLVWIDVNSAAPPEALSLDAMLVQELHWRERLEWSTVLGRAFVSPDAPNWRPIRISFEATQGVMALRTSRRARFMQSTRDPDVERALGRVLAHEIGHVLLAVPNHDPEGLMRAHFSPDELAAEDPSPFCLTPNDVGRLGDRIRVLRSIAAKGLAAPSPMRSGGTLDPVSPSVSYHGINRGSPQFFSPGDTFLRRESWWRVVYHPFMESAARMAGQRCRFVRSVLSRNAAAAPRLIQST